VSFVLYIRWKFWPLSDLYDVKEKVDSVISWMLEWFNSSYWNWQMTLCCNLQLLKLVIFLIPHKYWTFTYKHHDRVAYSWRYLLLYGFFSFF
jgi:hypothetical protein